MKLSALFMLGFCLHLSARTTGQTVTLSVKDMPLKEVFRAIQRQTGLNIVVNESVLEKTGSVSLTVKDMPVADVLNICFRNEKLSFSIIDGTIVIKSLGPLPSDVADSPPIDIHGHVTDTTGSPLVGASITIRGKSGGTVTDANGNFSLNEVDPKATVIISYTGFEKREYRLNGSNEINIQLVQKVKNLEDVVVNKGYYSVSQRLNTGDVAIVSGKTIEQQPVTDPILALEGRAAGLVVNQASGMPGAYSTVRIRGQNSIANGLDPLYIIDGVPYGNTTLTNAYIGGPLGIPKTRPDGPQQNNGLGASPFNNLNPADIESIEILKDADASAIYGSRGANGVILITTKKGKAGQTRVDANVYTGWGTVTRTFDLLNTQQYLQMRREAFKNDGAVPNINRDFDLTYWDTTRYTDWQKTLIGNTSHLTNAQASLSGGNANNQYLIGIGYSNQGTVFPGNYADKKASVHISMTNATSNQRFRSQFSASYTNDNNQLPTADFTPSITLAPDAPALYNPDGNFNWQTRGGSATWTNPLAATKNQASALTDNLVGSLNLNYQLLSNLQLKLNTGYTNSQMNQANLFFATSVAPPNNTNPNVRSNRFATQISTSWIIEPQINFHQRIGQGSLDVLVGSTFQENTGSSIGYIASGFISDALVPNPSAATTKTLLNYFISDYKYNAVYGRIGYNYQEKYLINITGRRDGSSRFGPDKQFGNFGSVGAAWIFSKETFVQNNFSWISFGKLRASYGTAGNDGLPNYKYLDTYSSDNTGTTYQGVSGLYPSQITNPYYAWEMIKKFEIALEMNILKDRFSFSVSYYSNRTDNQLVGYPLSWVTGFSTVQYNLPAVIQNKGLEIVLNTTNIRSASFLWTTSLNLTLPSNKLVAYPNIDNSSYQFTYEVGKSLATRFLYRYTGVDPQTGLYTVATKDGSGNPDYINDNYFTEPVTQQYYGGLNNSIGYKGLQLDIFFQFVKQTGFNYLLSFSQPGLNNNNVPTEVMNRWQQPGDESNVQRFSQNSAINAAYTNLRSSDEIIADASYIRLKNVALSYQLPARWIQKASLLNAKVYLQAQNLFTITNYKGIDPETQGIGLPPLRMTTIGLQIGF